MTLLRPVWQVLQLAPWFLASVFGALLLRAYFAFGDWPRYSANDPWALANRAHKDSLHDLVPYDAHINLVYWLMPVGFIVGLMIVVALIAREKWRKSIGWIPFAGCVAMFTLLFYQSGRFLIWFLD